MTGGNEHRITLEDGGTAREIIDLSNPAPQQPGAGQPGQPGTAVQMASQDMTAIASTNGQQPVTGMQGVALLTEEEKYSPAARAACRVHAIDMLRHGTEPADVARALARLSTGALIWDPKYGSWLGWVGSHWNPSDAGAEDAHRQARRVRDAARTLRSEVRKGLDDTANRLVPDPGLEVLAKLEITLEQYQRSEVEGMLGSVVKQLSTKRMQADILGQAASHDGIMHRTDDIRSRKNVLNFSNCTVALDSGQWWLHDPRDVITHCLPYAYDPSAQCPRFRHLVWCMTGPEDDWSDAHREMFVFVLRVLGYCLIYGNPEQLVFFLTGPTKTGKTTAIEIVGRLLGPAGAQEQAGADHRAAPRRPA